MIRFWLKSRVITTLHLGSLLSPRESRGLEIGFSIRSFGCRFRFDLILFWLINFIKFT